MPWLMTRIHSVPPITCHTALMTNPDEATASSAEDATPEGDEILEEASGGSWDGFWRGVTYKLTGH